METVNLPEQAHGELIPVETIEAIAKAIAERFSPQKIIIFGSYSSLGSPTPDSDLDLLVVMSTDLPPAKRSIPLQLLFRPMPCSMDILVYTPQEVDKWNGTVNHIITTAFQTGTIYYDSTNR
ncbi:MAG: nucleotidyltransferase domain-containing protein [Deltaproteobacteria bacterium]